MPRSTPGRRPNDDDLEEDEEDDDEAEEEEDEEEPSPRRRRRPPARRTRPRSSRPPVRRWRASEDEDEEEELAGSAGPPTGKKKPVYWRARDSLFFEPLVALAVIIVLIVALFAYTQNWPPMYVVESRSMQHGSADQIGLINAGDLVLAQKVPFASITPYVTGTQTGYSTYGEYGDVLLYWPNGASGSTPIIHRAILFLEWNPRGYYNATDLQGLPCGNASTAIYATPGTPATSTSAKNCGTTGLTGTLVLYRIGWMSLNISLSLSSPLLGDHSGFLTLGDNNNITDQTFGLSELVEPGWVIGAARGMIPWFGAVKLLLQGEAGNVPPQSWQFLGLTVVAAILVAFGVHYALRTEGIETPMRRREEEAAHAKAEAEASSEPAPPGFWSHFRRRRPKEDDEDEEVEESRRRRSRPPPDHSPTRRGRPAPRVRRATRSSKKRGSDDEL